MPNPAEQYQTDSHTTLLREHQCVDSNARSVEFEELQDESATSRANRRRAKRYPRHAVRTGEQDRRRLSTTGRTESASDQVNAGGIAGKREASPSREGPSGTARAANARGTTDRREARRIPPSSVRHRVGHASRICES